MTQTPPRILVVDDEPQIRALMRERLAKEGFSVLEAADGKQALDHLATLQIDLVTLDLRLGGEDGLALAREIRSRRNVPIIIISAKGDEIDRIVGLELGADDYVTKPFSPREVVARIKAVLRRYEAQPAGQPAAETAMTPNGARFAFAGGLLDTARRSFNAADGGTVSLTTAEFDLLELFLRHPQRVLSRDEIMTLLKGQDWSPLDRTVNSAVARLRRKIEPDQDRPEFIKTVRNIGYVFAGDVRKV